MICYFVICFIYIHPLDNRDESCSIELNDVIMSSNRAESEGGGLWTRCAVRMVGCHVINNTAWDGGEFLEGIQLIVCIDNYARGLLVID